MSICYEMGNPGGCGKWTEELWSKHFDFMAENLPADDSLPILGLAGKLGSRGVGPGKGSPLTGACSFSGDTKVLMADGAAKRLDEVQPGDEVIAADPESGAQGPRVVEHVWIHPDELIDLEVGGALLTTTEDHPFWNHTDRQWQRADQLDPGDLVLSPRGLHTVGGLVRSSTQTSLAYNLTVSSIHTYYVLAGNTPVLVHNTNGCRTASKYEDITSPGARMPNRLTDVGPNEFGRNLEANGWIRTDKGPNIMYEKDGARYFLRGKADSYGGWTADFYKAGSKKADIKIRLGDD
ncbi:hypothetical protein JQN84_28410 [Micromonospora sp. MMS20-R2-29]|uniref:Hint domain-containing protein n=2 Tax=Micromonospora humidisoli TaxID=2807622 RepID=A0ABS2JIZ2_9ACTN|nr:hypothetical protein [Micromonospora humidisoli]